ncbi:hypothetical protein EI94DRAFT_1809403 [Lactarius quietus]|nr:hypothetical protein EI94DRAFT_1809403 [Lactarius quietus]
MRDAVNRVDPSPWPQHNPLPLPPPEPEVPMLPIQSVAAPITSALTKQLASTKQMAPTKQSAPMKPSASTTKSANTINPPPASDEATDPESHRGSRTTRPLPQAAFLRRETPQAALGPNASLSAVDNTHSETLPNAPEGDTDSITKASRHNIAMLADWCDAILDALNRIAAKVESLKSDIKEIHKGDE